MGVPAIALLASEIVRKEPLRFVLWIRVEAGEVTWWALHGEGESPTDDGLWKSVGSIARPRTVAEVIQAIDAAVRDQGSSRELP